MLYYSLSEICGAFISEAIMKKWIIRAGWAVVCCALITLGYLGFDREPVRADGTSRFGAVVVSGAMNAQLSNANTARQIAVGPDGSIYVVFRSSNVVYVAKSSDEGASFAGAVSVTTMSISGDAEIAVSSSGEVYVCWVSGSNAYVARSDNGATSFGSPVSVGSAGTSVHMATDGSNVYLIDRTGTHFYSSSDSAATFTLYSFSDTYVFSDVMVNPRDHSVVVQKDNPTIVCFISHDGGKTFGAKTTMSASVNYSVSTIGIYQDTPYLMSCGYSTMGYRINLTSNTASAIANLGSNITPQGRSVCSDIYGNFITGYLNGGYVYFQTSTDMGTTMSSPTLVAAATSAFSAINDRTGDVFVLYQSGTTIYLQTFSSLLLGYDLQVSTGSLSFDSNSGTMTQTVQITNSSTHAIPITSVNTDNANFQVNTSSVPASLASGGSFTLPVTFKPGSAGTYTGNLRISYGSSQVRVVTLSGIQRKSSECDVLSVQTPLGASIDAAARKIAASVSDQATPVIVAVTTSPLSSWKMYSDSACTKELASHQLPIVYGTNTAYILVTAENGSTTKKYTIEINNADTHAPNGGTITGNPTVYQTSDAVITVTGASDTGSGLAPEAYSFDGGATWQSDNFKTFSGNRTGVTVKVRDVAGNSYSFAPFDITYIDKDAPVYSAVIGNPLTWVADSATLNIQNASDAGVGLSSTPYSFDGGISWQSDPTKVFTANDGTIAIVVRDALGNMSTPAAEPISFIDDSAPTIGSITGNPSDYSPADVTLNIGGASDSQSGLAAKPYSFDGGVTWQAENEKTYNTNTNSIQIFVRDAVGHVTKAPALDIDKIDKQGPRYSNVSGIPTEWTSSDVTLTVDGAKDDGAGLMDKAYSFDGGVTWQAENFCLISANTDHIAILLRDAVGNVTSLPLVKIDRIDKQIPVIRIDGVVTDYVKEIPLSLSVTSVQSSGVLTVQKDGGAPIALPTGSLKITGNGNYVFIYTTGSGITVKKSLVVTNIELAVDWDQDGIDDVKIWGAQGETTMTGGLIANGDADFLSAAAAVKGMSDSKELKTLFRLELFQNNVPVQPSGYITVRILVPANLQKETGLDIVYVSGDKSIQKMNAVRDGNYLVFSINHLSEYGLIGQASATDVLGTSRTSVTPTPVNGSSAGTTKTGERDVIVLPIAVGLALASSALILGCVIRNRRKIPRTSETIDR